jgi:hypothetical protein
MMVLVWLCRQGRMFRITLGHSAGRGQRSYKPTYINPNTHGFFPAKVQGLVNQKSYFYIFSAILRICLQIGKLVNNNIQSLILSLFMPV